jgi:hypothetical protein
MANNSPPVTRLLLYASRLNPNVMINEAIIGII